MAVITFMTTKGGAGKTTGALILGTVLAEQGASVCLIDADPNQPLANWAKEANMPKALKVIGEVTEENIIETIEEQAAQNSFVIVDLEGSANLSTGYAMSESDLILIPLQPHKFDADEATKTLKLLLRQRKTTNRKLPARVFWSRMPAAYTTKSAKHIGTQFEEAQIPFLETKLFEREAFKGIGNFGETLENLSKEQVPSLDRAKANAAEFVSEVIALLKGFRK